MIQKVRRPLDRPFPRTGEDDRRYASGCRCLFHSPARGSFHLSLTVLVHYRSSPLAQASRVVPRASTPLGGGAYCVPSTPGAYLPSTSWTYPSKYTSGVPFA